MFAAPAPALIPLQNLKQYPNDTRTLLSNGVKPAGYVVMTLVTVGLSIGFGELAHAVNKKVNITVTNLLGSGIE